MESQMNCEATGASDLLFKDCTMLRLLGEGTFGQVALFKNNETSNTTAVWIPWEEVEETAEEEQAMLEALSVLDPDTTNIVRFYGCFRMKGRLCLAFETLDRSLDDLVGTQQKPLLCSEIRPVAKQLLEALDALKGIGIVHTDIKPDNVMVVNARDQPLRVKLIDFGLAMPVSSIRWLMEVQIIGYRAPEVFLGQVFTETAEEYSACNRVPTNQDCSFLPSSLDSLLEFHRPRDAADTEDRRGLLDLLKELLQVDGDKRITPHQALQHSYLMCCRIMLRRWSTSFCLALKDSDSDIVLREYLEVPVSPPRVSVSSLDSAVDLGEQLEVPCCPPTVPVASLDSAISLREELEVPCSPPEVPVARLDSAVGLAELLQSGSSDSASSSSKVQQEDAVSLSHIQLSRSEGEPSSSASTGRFRRTLKRIRRFFRRVHKTMCCCSSPPID